MVGGAAAGQACGAGQQGTARTRLSGTALLPSSLDVLLDTALPTSPSPPPHHHHTLLIVLDYQTIRYRPSPTFLHLRTPCNTHFHSIAVYSSLFIHQVPLTSCPSRTSHFSLFSPLPLR